jgi:transposase
MQIYSKDLRVRAVAVVERGIPRREVAETFSVSLTTLKRWLRTSREGKDLSPRFSTGRRRRILATTEEERALWEQLEGNDEATLERHCELWEHKTGVRVSISAMSRAIRNKLGWTHKKRRWVPRQEVQVGPGVVAAVSEDALVLGYDVPVFVAAVHPAYPLGEGGAEPIREVRVGLREAPALPQVVPDHLAGGAAVVDEELAVLLLARVPGNERRTATFVSDTAPRRCLHRPSSSPRTGPPRSALPSARRYSATTAGSETRV